MDELASIKTKMHHCPKCKQDCRCLAGKGTGLLCWHECSPGLKPMKPKKKSVPKE